MRFKRLIFASLISAPTLLPLISAESQQIVYPKSERGTTVDSYFGTRVPDPYRWMEELNSGRTHAWVTAQNAYTNSYLAQFPLRDTLRNRLTQLYNYSRASVPKVTPDGKLFYRRNTGLQNQSVLYMRASVTAAPVVVIDPNTLSTDGSIAFQEWEPSSDGRYVAYGLSQGGSDWRTVHVRDVTTGRDLTDSVGWVRFSGLAWTRDGRGFFYSRYPAPPAGQELIAALVNHSVYYHAIGTAQAQDRVVFARPELARYFVGCSTTDDGRYLFCSASAGADSRNRLYFADLGDPMHPNLAAPVTPIVEEDVAQFQVIDNVGTTAYILTDEQSPHRRVVTLNLKTPPANMRANMRTLIPESKYAIESALMAGGRVALHYLEDVKSIVRLFDQAGRPTGAIPLPGVGTVGSESGRNDSPTMFYNFASPLVPGTVYAFNVRSHANTPFDQPQLTFDPKLYETRQLFSTSKDGTRIPLFITMKRGMVLDGSHPTLLYAYGGFDVSLQPFFSAAIPAWIERGGVYVTASLRGGAEYGETWHRAGMRERKQNVFDDFIGAAEYLVSQRYTSPGKLVIQGGSNGGLLIGAVSNQRPELFAVALPAVGVMDMLRYDKFTGGAGWVTEYGSSSDSAMFPYLYRYSPLQNIKPGTCYPATLATTADHDDRVVPSHTFKYIATLQAAQGCAKPIMVRVETQGSHGYRPTDKQIAETADELTFALMNLR